MLRTASADGDTSPESQPPLAWQSGIQFHFADSTWATARQPRYGAQVEFFDGAGYRTHTTALAASPTAHYLLRSVLPRSTFRVASGCVSASYFSALAAMSSAIRRLAEEEFRATFAEPMQRVGPEEYPPFDFWPYFEAIPQEHFEGYDCSGGSVTYAWRTGDGRYEHVLVDSDDRDVFMVLVLDLSGRCVAGHYLLDFPHLYGGD